MKRSSNASQVIDRDGGQNEASLNRRHPGPDKVPPNVWELWTQQFFQLVVE